MACNLLWLFVLHLSPELGHVFEYLMGMEDRTGGALVFILKKWVMQHMLNVLERPESGVYEHIVSRSSFSKLKETWIISRLELECVCCTCPVYRLFSTTGMGSRICIVHTI